MTKKREKLVLEHMGQVKWMAHEIKRKVPSQVSQEDLEQAGMAGLVDAANRYDSSVKFWTFAYYRVRGAMLDSLRDLDGATRSARTMQKKADAFTAECLHANKRSPSDEEMAEHLEMPVKRWLKWKIRFLHMTEIPFEPIGPGIEFSLRQEFHDKGPQPDEQLQQAQLKLKLGMALCAMSALHRSVLEDYFFKDKTLTEIGKTFGGIESRASQVKAEALCAMRAELERAGLNLEAML